MYQLKDITDSRDVIDRLNELQRERDGLVEITAHDGEISEMNLEDWDAENKEELDALAEFCEEGKRCNVDFSRGTLIISDEGFTYYATDLGKDVIGDSIREWPLNHIDWDNAADEIKADFSKIRYDCKDYYVRNT